MKYTVIVEKGESSYGAFVPDLPGCIAVGEDREQTLRLIEEAVTFHIEGLRAEGLPPPPQCDIAQVEVMPRDDAKDTMRCGVLTTRPVPAGPRFSNLSRMRV